MKLTGKNFNEKMSICKEIEKNLKREQEKNKTFFKKDCIKKYSDLNQVLILMQHPDPDSITELKGFVGWKGEDRKCNRGEGIIIRQPRFYNDKESGDQVLGGFKFVSIWDRQNTTPK